MLRNFITYPILLLISICIMQSALAKDKPTLTIYSYDSFMSEWGAGPKIKQDFEAVCDCNVNIVSIGDGVMILNRLKFEGKRSKADVVLGLDTSLISIAEQADLVQPHQLVKPANLAVNWWDNQFIPYDYGYFAFIYDSYHITNPPKNFTELLSDEHNWKIVYQDPRTSTPGLGLLLWINKVYGVQANQAWQQLAKHTLTVTKGWSESYGLFLKGEADFVLSYSTSPVVHILNDAEYRYKAAIFEEGHYQQIEVAAITKQSKHVELAQQFLQFLLTDNIQQLFAEKNIMYPAMNVKLPLAYSEVNLITKPLSFDTKEVMDNQKRWINQWRDIVSQ